MQFYVKNKYFSFGGSSYVEDDQKNRLFKVKGKFFSFTHKKKIYDMDGNLCYVVRDKFWRLFKTSTFIFDDEGNKIATLSNHDWDFKNKFVLTGGTDDITISGNLFQFPNIKLQVVKNDKPIGYIIKEFNMFKDTFRVEVEDSEDAAFMVALVISIDNIYDSRRRN